MDTNRDRRRKRRVRLPESHGSLVVSLDGTVLDISLSGMAVETNTRLAPHRALTLRLGNGGRALSLTGRVVWCFLHGTKATASGEQLPVYRAGIQFQDVLSPQAQDLVRFLESHAIVTLETRLFGRFRIAEDDSVEVSSSAEFRVVELDANGVTVETSIPIEAKTACEVEIQLDGDAVRAHAIVREAHKLAAQDTPESWRVQLEFTDLDDDSRARIQEFLRAEVGASPEEPG